MSESLERRSFPVWLVAAVGVVVVLVVGMTAALLDPEWQVDSLDEALYPPGAKVSLLGAGELIVEVGRKEMGPGWMAVGAYRFRVKFPDGAEYTSEPGALKIVDKADLVVRCVPATHQCEASR